MGRIRTWVGLASLGFVMLGALRTVAGDDDVGSIMLRDVQALFGGQNVYVGDDGAVAVQVVKRRPDKTVLWETRYEWPLDREFRAEMERAIVDHHFFEIVIGREAGKPDEARPTIRVVLKSGRSRTVAKWENDPNKDFEAIQKKLLDLVKQAQKRKPFLEGPYDSNWRPKGFRDP